MRQRLAALGFQMPLEPLSFNGLPFDEEELKPGRSATTLVASNYTAGRSSDTLVHSEAPMLSSPKTRPLKRQRVDSPRVDPNIHALPSQQHELDSRDLMPPPAKPLSRMKSIKKFLPTLRRKASNGRASPALNSGSDPVSDIHMYDNGHWQNLHRSRLTTINSERPPTRHGPPARRETPYMTGALPVGHAPRLTSSPRPQMILSSGVNRGSAEFSFRSPIRPTQQQRDPLPSEPSYIRLMDGLARDTGMDLGLIDPRQNGLQELSHEEGQCEEAQSSPIRNRGIDDQKRWSYGHAFLHQPPNDLSSPVLRHSNQQESHLVNDSNIGPFYNPTMDPITPAPRPFQQPAETVVSPFFKSSSGVSHSCLRDGVTEREDSSLQPFSGYQSQKSRMPPAQSDWREPRGLNGLSFFNSPINARHELIDPNSQYVKSDSLVRPDRPNIARNLDSRGFIVRSDVGRSTFRTESAYGSLGGDTFSRPTQGSTRPAPSFLAFNRSSHSRAAPLPSSMPSIVSNQRSVVLSSQANWDHLAHAGVRTGRPTTQIRVPRNTFVSPTKNIFSSSGRRIVRR